MIFLRLLPYAAILTAILSWSAYMWSQGNNHCEAKYANAKIAGDLKHDELEKIIITLPDAALRQRYCKWVRDDRKKCLQANIPVGE